MYIESFDKTRIFYKTIKSKKPKGTILFIHGGFFGNHTLLKKIYSHFQDNYDLILPDVRGKGDSGFSENRVSSLKDYAKDMYCLLKKENIREVYIVGVSFGGLITLKFCELFSKEIKIKKIILVSSSYTTKHAKKNVFISKMMVPSIKGIVTFLDKVWVFKEKKRSNIDYSKLPKRFFHISYGLNLAKNNSVKTLLKRYKAGFNILEHEVKEGSLKKINIPVLLIWGDKDNLFKKDIQEKTAGLLKKSEKRIIKGGDHNIYLHNSKEVVKYIRDFLD